MSHIKITRPGFIHRGKEIEVGTVIEYPYFAALALVSAHKAIFVQTSGPATGPTAAPKPARGGNAAPESEADMPSDGADATESDSSPTPPASTPDEPTDGSDEPTGDIDAREGDDEPDDDLGHLVDDEDLSIDELIEMAEPVGEAGLGFTERVLVESVAEERDHNQMGKLISALWPGETPSSKAARLAYLQSRLEE